MSKYERLARLLKIIVLVKANPRLNRSDLAQLCEVNSVRTIQRDIDSLTIAGVPIYWSGEGYRIMSEFFLPPLALSAGEVLCLVYAAKAFSKDKDKLWQQTIESAVSKIVAIMPDGVRNQLEQALDETKWNGKKINQILEQIVESLSLVQRP